MTPYEQMLTDEYQRFAAGRFLNNLLDAVELDARTKQHIRLTGMRLLCDLPYRVSESDAA